MNRTDTINSLARTTLILTYFLKKNFFFKIFFLKQLYVNHIYVYLKHTIREILYFCKLSLYTYFTTLVDLIGVDLSNLPNYNFITKILEQSKTPAFKFLIIYNLLDYNTSYRIIFNSFYTKRTTELSLHHLYRNSSWLERELVEFFGFQIDKQYDTRNLLLDYHFIWNPLLKSFPVEGYQEIFYNFSTHTLDYIQSEFIEL